MAHGPMKTLTIIAAGLVVTASGVAASSIPLRRSPLDHTARIAEQARVQRTPAKKETLQVPRTMLGLPRNG